MSVIMTLRAHGDAKLLEQRAQGNPAGMQALDTGDDVGWD